MTSPNILVTGGAGYIGSHACKALARAGYTLVTYDNLVHGHRWAVKWWPLEQGDVGNRQRLDDVFRRYRPQAVMHFAAYANVGESVQHPGKYYNNNFVGSLTLLEAMRDHGVDAIVRAFRAGVLLLESESKSAPKKEPVKLKVATPASSSNASQASSSEAQADAE